MESIIPMEPTDAQETLALSDPRETTNGTRPPGRPRGTKNPRPPRPSLDKKPFLREIVSPHATQVQIPQELRDALHWTCGDTVVMWKENDTIVMRTIRLEIKSDELIIRT